MLHHC